MMEEDYDPLWTELYLRQQELEKARREFEERQDRQRHTGRAWQVWKEHCRVSKRMRQQERELADMNTRAAEDALLDWCRQAPHTINACELEEGEYVSEDDQEWLEFIETVAAESCSINKREYM